MSELKPVRYVDAKLNERIVECFCAHCGVKFDGMVQYCVQGNWGPDIQRTLEAIGWIVDDGHIYCGKLHRERHAYAKRRDESQLRKTGDPVQPKPVERLSDASWRATNGSRRPHQAKP